MISAEEGYGSDSYEIAVAEYLLGKCEFLLGRIEIGIKYTVKALETFIKIEGKENLDAADAYFNLSLMNFKQNQYESSLDYLEKSMKIYEKQNKVNTVKYALCLENKGMTLLALKKKEEAYQNLNLAINLASKISGDNSTLSKIYLNVARLFVEYFPEQKKAALTYCEKVIELLKGNENSALYNEASLMRSSLKNHLQL